MEEGGNNMEVTHESRRDNFVPQDVESEKREREEVIMEEGGNNMKVTHESRRENLVPQDVESASRSEMSSGSWMLSVQEFPALSRGGDHQHGFFSLCSFLHVPCKYSFMNIHILHII